ncbi:hypothetical protein ACX93W_05035 [Paenibacillus sp. CAU 1782]
MMNLSDMLGYADIGQLSRIAAVYNCQCNGNSKNDLIQSILSTVSRHDVFDSQIDTMKLDELRFLNSLLFENREAYSLEDLVARAQQSRFGLEQEPAKSESAPTKPKQRKKKQPQEPEPFSPRDMILRFKHQGWLFNGFSGPNRYMFQVPGDLKERFRETLRRRFAEELVYSDEPPFYRDEQTLLKDDVNLFLKYVQRHEIGLMPDGSMYKRFVLQALEHMAIREEMPSKGEWRFGYGRHFNQYPDRFSFLYDYCMSIGALEESGGRLTVAEGGRARLAEPPLQDDERLYRYWLKLYKTPVSNLLSLVHWIQALASDWVTAESLKKSLLPFVKPYYYDSAEAVLERRVWTMMLHLGLLRIGEHPLHGTVLRMTRAGNAIVTGEGLREGR